MTTPGVVVEIGLVVVAAVLLVLALIALRRLQQLRRGGVDVALRRAPSVEATSSDPAQSAADDQRGWHSGIARYRGDQFRWYRISGLRSGPNVVLDRFDVQIVDRRPSRPTELHAPGATVLRCRTSAGSYEVAMSVDVLTGFSSWLESKPPGRSTGYRQAG